MREEGTGKREEGRNEEKSGTPEVETMPISEKIISRRRALQVLGAVPVAAAIGQQPGQQQKPLTPAVTPPVPTKPAATPGAAAAAPHFFNNHEWRTVRALVDYIMQQRKAGAI